MVSLLSACVVGAALVAAPFSTPLPSTSPEDLAVEECSSEYDEGSREMGEAATDAMNETPYHGETSGSDWWNSYGPGTVGYWNNEQVGDHGAPEFSRVREGQEEFVDIPRECGAGSGTACRQAGRRDKAGEIRTVGYDAIDGSNGGYWRGHANWHAWVQ